MLTMTFETARVLDQVRKAKPTDFQSLGTMSIYYTEYQQPNGIYLKTGTRSAWLLKPTSFIVDCKRAQVEEAEAVRPSPEEEVYELDAEVKVAEGR